MTTGIMTNGNDHIRTALTDVDGRIDALEKNPKGPAFIQMGALKDQIKQYIKDELYQTLLDPNDLITGEIQMLITNEVNSEVAAKTQNLQVKIDAYAINNATGMININLELEDIVGNIIPGSISTLYLNIAELLRMMKTSGMHKDIFPDPPDPVAMNPAMGFFTKDEA